MPIDPVLANGVLASLDQYTPLINESAVDLRRSMAPLDEDGFVGSTNSGHPAVTEATKLEVEYTVQKGDTITGIADKFELHVATIAERNHISIDQIEHLSPGDTIIIPPSDTSDSSEWLVQLNQKKEQARQKALADAQAARQKIAHSALLAQSQTSIKQTADTGFDGNAGTNFIVPITSIGISRGISSYHLGIDYRAPVGTSVRAAQAGKVIETTGGWAGGFGNSILIDHGSGLNTRYAHLSQIEISVGQTVSQGQEIGKSGNTGFSTGPHLHFETRQNGRVLNPFGIWGG